MDPGLSPFVPQVAQGMAAGLKDRATERVLLCRLYIRPSEPQSLFMKELDKAVERFHKTVLPINAKTTVLIQRNTRG